MSSVFEVFSSWTTEWSWGKLRGWGVVPVQGGISLGPACALRVFTLDADDLETERDQPHEQTEDHDPKER